MVTGVSFFINTVEGKAEITIDNEKIEFKILRDQNGNYLGSPHYLKVKKLTKALINLLLKD